MLEAARELPASTKRNVYLFRFSRSHCLKQKSAISQHLKRSGCFLRWEQPTKRQESAGPPSDGSSFPQLSESASGSFHTPTHQELPGNETRKKKSVKINLELEMSFSSRTKPIVDEVKKD